MGKTISYKFLSCEINHGTKEVPDIEQIFLNKSITYSETNEETAKREAYNGEYFIEDDGLDEVVEPTQLDRVEAQVTYTAMMTDTLLGA